MIIAYLYNRPVSEGEAMGAERTFADYRGTARQELSDMIERAGIRKGDTLVLRALSDLGQGAESKRLQKMITDLGVWIEVKPGPEGERVQGRKAARRASNLRQSRKSISAPCGIHRHLWITS